MMDKERNPHKLWYTSPAGGWLQAMPLGDGRLGAMVYGGTARETIQFNEDSVWTRAEEDMNNPDALARGGSWRPRSWRPFPSSPSPTSSRPIRCWGSCA